MYGGNDADTNQSAHGYQGGYPPQQGNPMQGYPSQQGYPPQQGYPMQGYPAQGGYGQGRAQPGYGAPPSYYQPSNENNAAAVSSSSQDREMTAFNFSEQSIRRAFIRKVYFILMLQLLVTMAIMAPFIFVDSVRNYSRHNKWMYILGMVGSFATLIALACCPDLRRKFPVNFIVLALFTLCEGFMLGNVVAFYETQEVFMAVGITAFVSFALTIFAFQTKWDFTYLTGILFVFTIILMVFGFLMIFFYSKVMMIVYSSLGALLFAVYLVVDTQLMMGGKHKYSLSPEEYIFAALNLYLDIVNMFIFILSLIGLASD